MTHPEPRPGRHAEKLHVQHGLLAVFEDPHRFLEIVLAAEDDHIAVEALCQQFDLDPAQSRAALGMPCWMMTAHRRHAIQEEADRFGPQEGSKT